MFRLTAANEIVPANQRLVPDFNVKSVLVCFSCKDKSFIPARSQTSTGVGLSIHRFVAEVNGAEGVHFDEEVDVLLESGKFGFYEEFALGVGSLDLREVFSAWVERESDLHVDFAGFLPVVED